MGEVQIVHILTLRARKMVESLGPNQEALPLRIIDCYMKERKIVQVYDLVEG
jgi:hypothetical protein